MLQTILKNLSIINNNDSLITKLPASLTITNDQLFAEKIRAENTTTNFNYTNKYHGNIGDNIVNVTIELPDIYVDSANDKYSLATSKFKVLASLISNATNDKIISRRYLLDNFKIIELNYNDLSSYSPNGYSFTPLLFNDGKKIPSIYVGILRIISTGQTYLLLDYSALSSVESNTTFYCNLNKPFDCIIEPIFLKSYLTNENAAEFTLDKYRTSIYNKNQNKIIQIGDINNSKYEYLNNSIVNKSCLLYMTKDNKYYPISSKYYNAIADICEDIDSIKNGSFTVLNNKKYSDYIDRYNFLLRLSSTNVTDIADTDTKSEVTPYNYIRLIDDYTLTIIDKRLLPSSEIIKATGYLQALSFKIFSPEDISIYTMTGTYLHPFIDYNFILNNDNTLSITGLSNNTLYEIIPDHTNEIHYLGSYNCNNKNKSFTNETINHTLHNAELLGCRIDFTKYRIPVYIDGKLSIPDIKDNKLTYIANNKITLNYLFNTALDNGDLDTKNIDDVLSNPVYNNTKISNDNYGIKQDFKLNHDPVDSSDITISTYAVYTGTGTAKDNDSIGIDEIYTIPVNNGHALIAKTSDNAALTISSIENDIKNADENYSSAATVLQQNNLLYDNKINDINGYFTSSNSLYNNLLKFAISIKDNPVNKIEANDAILSEISKSDLDTKKTIYKLDITENKCLAILLEANTDISNYFVYFKPNSNSDGTTPLPFKFTPYKANINSKIYLFILYPKNASGTLYYYTNVNVDVYEIL